MSNDLSPLILGHDMSHCVPQNWKNPFALVLTLLAIPLAHVNPRMGRSFNLLAAAFLYMLYSNCLNIVQSLIAQGKIGFWAGLLIPHGAAALLVVVLFRHRMSVSGWRLRRPAPAA